MSKTELSTENSPLLPRNQLGSGTVITDSSEKNWACPAGCTFDEVKVEFRIEACGWATVNCKSGTNYEEEFDCTDEADLAEAVDWYDYLVEKSIVGEAPECGKCGQALVEVPINSVRLIQEFADESDEGESSESTESSGGV